MEPLPEVQEAAAQLSALTGELDLLRGLSVLAQVAQALVPSIVGVSMTIVADGEPYTVTATDEATAGLDAVQYLGGGPCLEAATEGQVVAVEDMLDESRWQDLYVPAAGALGVRASLSLPIGLDGAHTPGAVNLYAADPHAFHGREALLAEVFQAPTDAFVSNADLSFTTREAARELPQRLERKAKLDQAVGMLIGQFGWSPDQARERLRTAASRAGTPIDSVADVLLELHGQ